MCIWKRCLHPFRTSVAVLPLGILHVLQHLGFSLNHQVDFELQRLLNFGDAAANCGSERNLHSYLWVWAPLLGFFFYFRCGKGYNKLFMETAKKGRSIQESPARGIFFFWCAQHGLARCGERPLRNRNGCGENVMRARAGRHGGLPLRNRFACGENVMRARAHCRGKPPSLPGIFVTAAGHCGYYPGFIQKR